MTMQPEQGIGRELGLGEVISKTFEVYRREFAKYFVLFAIVGVIVQVVITLAQQTFVLPNLPVNATPQQFSAYFSALFGALPPALRRDLRCEYRILYNCRGQRSQTGL